MTEDEETVERPSPDQLSDLDETEFDRAAESFLELEADLDDQLGEDETVDPGQFRGLVVDAERVDVDAVPDGYPVDVHTDSALALRADRGDGETTVYLEWPGDDGEDAPLAWLLSAMDADLSDLYGRDVLLERVEGHDVLVVPSERPRGSDRWGPAVVVGHAVNVALLALLVATGGLSTLLYGIWVLLTVVGLPYATFRDAWYVRTHSDWGQGPLFWAATSVVPVLNVVAGLAYLWTRSRARFFGTERSLLGGAAAAVRSWL